MVLTLLPHRQSISADTSRAMLVHRVIALCELGKSHPMHPSSREAQPHARANSMVSREQAGPSPHLPLDHTVVQGTTCIQYAEVLGTF